MKLVSSKSIRASAVKSFNVVHARDAPSLTILPCKAGVGDGDDDDGGDGDGDGDGDGYFEYFLFLLSVGSSGNI